MSDYENFNRRLARALGMAIEPQQVAPGQPTSTVAQTMNARQRRVENMLLKFIGGGVNPGDARVVNPNGCMCQGLHVVGFRMLYWVSPSIERGEATIREFWGDRCGHLPGPLLPPNYGIGMIPPSDATIH